MFGRQPQKAITQLTNDELKARADQLQKKVDWNFNVMPRIWIGAMAAAAVVAPALLIAGAVTATAATAIFSFSVIAASAGMSYRATVRDHMARDINDLAFENGNRLIVAKADKKRQAERELMLLEALRLQFNEIAKGNYGTRSDMKVSKPLRFKQKLLQMGGMLP